MLGVVLLTAPLGIASRPLAVGNETRDAAIAKEMAESREFFATRLAGQPVFEKPPFFYASVASSIRLQRAVTPLSTRLPSVLYSAIALAATAAAASLLFSARAGLFSCMVLSTTYLFTVNAHDCVVDVALAAFVSLALLAFVAESRRAGFPRWGTAFGAAAAGALLAKGFVGLVLVGLLTLPFWLLAPSRRRLKESVSASAVALPATALLLWMGATWHGGGVTALSEALWTQQVGRFLGFSAEEYSHHRAPAYFYLAALPGILFPWVITLAAAATRGIRRHGRTAAPSAARALVIGFLAALLFLSIAGTKRTIYFLPLVPVAAILSGACLDRRLTQDDRAGFSLWAQFGVLGLCAIVVPLVPALSDDGRLTGGELSLVGAVAAACATLAMIGRRSARRLIFASLGLAGGALVLLDFYSLRQIDSDRHTRQFFARVERRLTPADRVYSYDLNEDVLGKAYLEMRRRLIRVKDPRRLGQQLSKPGAYLLAETAWVERRGREVAVPLDPVETGRAGRRGLALYRSRVDQAPSLAAAAVAASSGLVPTLASGGLLPHEAQNVSHAVWEKKTADRDREQNRRDDRGDLCSGCLAYPERLFGDQLFPEEQLFDHEVEDEGDGDPQQDPLPLSGEANHVFDAPAEKQAQRSPDHAIHQRGQEIDHDKTAERHLRGAGREKDDRPQAIEIASEEEKPVAVALERFPRLTHFPRGEHLLQELALFEVPAEESAEAVEDRVGDNDSAELGSDHQREPRDSLINEKAANQEDDLFRRAWPEGAQKEQKKHAEVGLALQVLGHYLERGLSE